MSSLTQDVQVDDLDGLVRRGHLALVSAGVRSGRLLDAQGPPERANERGQVGRVGVISGVQLVFSIYSNLLINFRLSSDAEILSIITD